MYNKYVEIFVEVADTGSFNKASEKFLVSPTAIMKQINLMESDLGLKLIERTHNGIKLTPSGKQIYRDSKYIIEYSQNAIQKAKNLEKKNNSIITVGTSIICPCKPLMDIWYKISEKYPEYKIKIVPFEEDHTNTLTNLRSNTVKFDIIVSPCDSEEWLKSVNFLKLGTYKYSISVPQNHRLAKKKVIDWKDLSNETIMMINEGDSKTTNDLRNIILSNCKNVSIKPIPFLYDISVFNECEEEGHILMTLDSWKDVHPSLVTIPLKEDFLLPYGILYDKKPSKNVKKFIDIIEENV